MKFTDTVKILSLSAFILSLSACQTVPQKSAEGTTPTTSEQSPIKNKADKKAQEEARKKAYQEKLQTIDDFDTVYYVCNNATPLIVMYGIDKKKDFVASKVNVQNIVTPALLGTAQSNGYVFRSFDNKVEFKIDVKKLANVMNSKNVSFMINSSQKTMRWKNCLPNEQLTQQLRDAAQKKFAEEQNDSDEANSSDAQTAQPVSSKLHTHLKHHKSVTKHSKQRKTSTHPQLKKPKKYHLPVQPVKKELK